MSPKFPRAVRCLVTPPLQGKGYLETPQKSQWSAPSNTATGRCYRRVESRVPVRPLTPRSSDTDQMRQIRTTRPNSQSLLVGGVEGAGWRRGQPQGRHSTPGPSYSRPYGPYERPTASHSPRGTCTVHL